MTKFPVAEYCHDILTVTEGQSWDVDDQRSVEEHGNGEEHRGHNTDTSVETQLQVLKCKR